MSISPTRHILFVGDVILRSAPFDVRSGQGSNVFEMKTAMAPRVVAWSGQN
jgi:hypothetical protein